MAETVKTNLERIVEEYEASGNELDLDDRLRYVIARSVCYGQEANTLEMKNILTTLAAPEHQTAKQLRSKLVKLFLFAELTGSELTYDLAKKVYTEYCRMPFDVLEE